MLDNLFCSAWRTSGRRRTLYLSLCGSTRTGWVWVRPEKHCGENQQRYCVRMQLGLVRRSNSSIEPERESLPHVHLLRSSLSWSTRWHMFTHLQSPAIVVHFRSGSHQSNVAF